MTDPQSAVPLSADPTIGPTLIDQSTIAGRIEELGAQISHEYAGRSPLIICVFRGAYVFTTDLAPGPSTSPLNSTSSPC